MSVQPHSNLDDVDSAIAAAGVNISSRDFLRIVDALAPSSTISQAETDFLIEGSSLDAADLQPRNVALAGLEIGALQARAFSEAVSASWTTAEVAQRLGRAASNVRRSVNEGRLYSPFSAESPRKTRLFPVWQFVRTDHAGRYASLPHLAEILRAVPKHLSPPALQHFMAQPEEELSGQSPCEWLANGHEPAPVLDLLDGLSRL
ncbi:MAG: hypothetical protein ACTIJJ_03050 [Galactobacter sp.]|uniref:hypothetical protein n=1 Tax=Galactobacter sp. TaxID=2676125 RepID=UPI0025C0C4D4|nr:hypothetical protein [Galactobacter sp.]